MTISDHLINKIATLELDCTLRIAVHKQYRSTLEPCRRWHDLPLIRARFDTTLWRFISTHKQSSYLKINKP